MVARHTVLEKLPVILSLAFFLGFASPPNSLAQGYATVSVKQSASSLSGVVRAGVSGEVLQKVSVAVCDRGFRQCSDVVTTDVTGHFSIGPIKNQKVYYLKFSLYGMDPEEVTVSLKHGAAPLEIKMIVAT